MLKNAKDPRKEEKIGCYEEKKAREMEETIGEMKDKKDKELADIKKEFNMKATQVKIDCLAIEEILNN